MAREVSATSLPSVRRNNSAPRRRGRGLSNAGRQEKRHVMLRWQRRRYMARCLLLIQLSALALEECCCVAALVTAARQDTARLKEPNALFTP